ncbi:MAG: hypothetical protein AB1556_07460 [Bacillota bacterium]
MTDNAVLFSAGAYGGTFIVAMLVACLVKVTYVLIHRNNNSS